MEQENNSINEKDIENQDVIIKKNKRITFRVDEKLHRKFKMLCVYNNQSVQELMEQLVLEKIVVYEQERPGIFNFDE